MDNLSGKYKNNDLVILSDFILDEDGYEFDTGLKKAMELAEYELDDITSKISENEKTIEMLTSDCDKTDYILAASSGALCGIIDIFLVGKAGDSQIGNLSDKWFKNRTMDFAKLCGWKAKNGDSPASAVNFLEKKFKIPYDQTGAGDAASRVFDLNPSNHHFKSLAHNPSILGLFFSILDQFENTSHFISKGELISLQEADNKFELRGNNFTAKLFCGFVNWFGHLVSDISGSSSSKGRGMGIPSPFWTWTNDIIVIKRKLNIHSLDFDKSVNELALQIYRQGYDIRFEAACAIPVFVNELIVRIIYSVRRLFRYFIKTQKHDRSFKQLWEYCKPYSNASVKRMLTVAHGTYCLVDGGEALAHGFISGGGSFNVADCLLRLNIVGLGRFSISLYGELDRGIKRKELRKEEVFLRQEKLTLIDYVEGLKLLSELYEDKDLIIFTDELMESEMYIKAFEKSALLAEKRNVSDEKILRNKADIDSYFRGGKKW
ncbi:hypothetical protein [Anaerococcus marasmi]|uniref:hypothetical protein n=1 Tax=Anaerococcus marasmi TaxID=2057797 RepID=UPI000CF87B78|nr:hypothetical protein [Anaerococcus marasmi]